MNLINLYQFAYEFDIDMHVVSTNEFDVDVNGKTMTIPKRTHGKILRKSSEIKMDLLLEDTTVLKDVSPSNFILLEELDAKTAYNTIRRFIGHHSDDDKVYQFNIKMHHVNVPDIAYRHFTSEEIEWIVFDEFESNLRSFMDEYLGGIMKYITWINRWYTAGRSNGYLMIEDRFNSLESYIDAEFYYLEAKSEYRDDLGYIEALYDTLKLEEKDLTELAYDLLLIEKMIKHTQQEIYEYLNSEIFWLEKVEINKEFA